MASDIEIECIRKDPDLWRSLAKRLQLGGAGLTDWEDTFTYDISSLIGVKELSFRQGEKLIQIRDDTVLVSEYHGQTGKFLIKTCKELSPWFDYDDDQAWVAKLFESGRTSVARKEAARLSSLVRRYRAMG